MDDRFIFFLIPNSIRWLQFSVKTPMCPSNILHISRSIWLIDNMFRTHRKYPRMISIQDFLLLLLLTQPSHTLLLFIHSLPSRLKPPRSWDPLQLPQHTYFLIPQVPGVSPSCRQSLPWRAGSRGREMWVPWTPGLSPTWQLRAASSSQGGSTREGPLLIAFSAFTQ